MKYGLFSGCLWGLDTVILGIALTMVPFIGTAAPMRSTPFSFVTVFSSGMKPG